MTLSPEPPAPAPRWLYGLVLLLALALPFEVTRVRLTLPWMEWTSLELLLAATLGGWLLHALRQGRSHFKGRWRDAKAGRGGVLLPALLWLFLVGLSALLAPTHRLEALKFATRFGEGLLLFFVLRAVATSERRRLGVIVAVVAGAGLSAALGLGEAAGWPWLAPLLSLFKAAPSRVGGELRVSATFPYATSAAMFFEMTIPLALALSGLARRPLWRVLAIGVAFASTAVVVLTLTRTGIAVLLAILVSLLGLALFSRSARRLVPSVALTLLFLLLLLGNLVWRSDTFRTRLITENDSSWYRAAYRAPATLTLATSEGERVTVEARNEGPLPWIATGSHRYSLLYRWLDESGAQQLALPPTIVPLPTDVPPGEAVQLFVQVRPLAPPGRYRLSWGMQQEGILAFRHRGVPEAQTQVEVTVGSGPAPPVALAGPADDSVFILPTTSRRELWRAALLMWRERPLLGVGPDNFRHLYGRYLGLTSWDERVSANNLYLELLATLGLLGFAAFGWLLLAALRPLPALLREPRTSLLALALGSALAAMLLHGLLDYFFGTTSLALFFWIVLGLVGEDRRT